jgi:hypothetical protein
MRDATLTELGVVSLHKLIVGRSKKMAKQGSFDAGKWDATSV